MSNRNELIILKGIVVGFHNAYHSYYVRNYICILEGVTQGTSSSEFTLHLFNFFQQCLSKHCVCTEIPNRLMRSLSCTIMKAPKKARQSTADHTT